LKLNDRFQAGIQTSGLKEGVVGLALNKDLNIITYDIPNRLQDIQNRIVYGAITVPGF